MLFLEQQVSAFDRFKILHCGDNSENSESLIHPKVHIGRVEVVGRESEWTGEVSRAFPSQILCEQKHVEGDPVT